MQCSMGGLMDPEDGLDMVSMRHSSTDGRFDHPGATDSTDRAAALQIGLLILMFTVFGVGCAGARYERGSSALDVAHGPVHLVHADAATADTASVLVMVRAGSAHDPVGQAGLSWITAQVIAERAELALKTADARVDVRVDKELVTYEIVVPAASQSDLPGVLSHMFDLSGLDDATIAQSKVEGQQWLTQGLATDAGRLADAAFERWIYEGHPYALPAQGRASALAAIDARSVQQFFASRYGRPSISIEVRGADKPEAIQAALSDAPPSLYVDVTPRPVGPVKSHEVLLVEHDTPTLGLVLGHPLRLRPSSEDWVALMVGLAASSPAPVEVLDRSLTRQDHAFQLRFSGDAAESGAALFDAAMTHTSSFVGRGLTDVQLAETKAALEAGLTEAHVLGGASRAHLMGRPDSVALLEAIRAVSLDQVNAALAKHIDPGALRVVVVGKADAFEGLTFETAHKVQGADLFQ